MTLNEISEILTQLYIDDSTGNKSKFATVDHVLLWCNILKSAVNFDAFQQLNGL